MSDRRIGRDAGKPVRPSAFQTHTQLRKRRCCASALVCFDQANESLPDRVRKHRRFSAALLLLQNEQRLVKIRIAFVDLMTEDSALRMLAAQAKYRSPGHVGMVYVTGDEPAKIVGIFTCAAAPAFMKKKFDAVDIFK